MRQPSLPTLSACLLAGLLAAPVCAQTTPSTLPAHVVRMPTGGYRPAAGYVWLNTTDNDARVRWQPGLRFPGNDNVVSGPQEGVWVPAAGYRWANTIPGDLTVVPTLRAPDEEAVKRAIVKILGAIVSNAASQPGEDDNLFQTLLRQGFRAGRDQLIESAVQDVFPDLAASQVQAVRRMIALDLDGRLDSRNWRSETAKDELINALRRENVDAANAVSVADFLYRVHQARASR